MTTCVYFIAFGQIPLGISAEKQNQAEIVGACVLIYPLEIEAPPPSSQQLISWLWCSFGAASLFDVWYFSFTFGSMQTCGICTAT